MTLRRLGRTSILTLSLALALGARAAGADSLLDGAPDRAPFHVVPGTTVQLTAHLDNLSGQTIFLRGLTYSSSETFTGSVSIHDFVAQAPDSLLPGDSWQGVIAVIDVPAGPGTNSGHRLDFFVTGGINPYDDEVVSELTFAVDDSTPTTAVGDTKSPRELELTAAPNPAGGTTRIHLALPLPGRVDLRLYDITGRVRRVFVAARLPAGDHAFVWDGRDAAGLSLPPGEYFLRAQTPSGSRRLTLARIR